MRLAFLWSAEEWTGSARAFAAAARAFSQAGDYVVFIVPPETRVQERVTGEGYEIEPMRTDGSWLGLVFRLRRALRRHRAEVVFVHTEREHLAAAIASRIGARVAIVRRIPHGGALSLGWRTRFAARISRTAFLFSSEADSRTALVRPKLGPSVVAELGVPERPDGDRREPAQPAVPTGEQAAAGDSSHLLCVYDGVARGRTALPIRTVALLAPRHPDIHLSVVGSGSDAEDIRMHVAALDILPRVDLLGERDDMDQLVRAAEVGWVACAGDDAAFATLDLMAAGLPVVAPDDAVSRRYVADGITGVLVRADDASLAAGALAGLLANTERMRTMGDAAQSRVAREFPESRMLEGFDRAARAARDRGKPPR